MLFRSVVLGVELARALGVLVGDKVVLIAPQGQVTPAGIIPRLRQFTVVGIFAVDHYEYDSGLALVRLEDAQALYRLGEGVSGVEVFSDERGQHVRIKLESGKQVVTDSALYSIGRTGATEKLNLDAAGVKSDSRGRVQVNENYQTSIPHIYAVGDVIGFPSLASTLMEQGRLAASHSFGIQAKSMPGLFPYGIYTIPEISTVGKTEAELTEAGVPYEVGKARYNEIARGQIIGDTGGLLKLLFHYDTRELLGVHIIGEGASELLHIGQAVLALGGTVDYFVNTVFNYPTLAECYKVAALNGMNKLRALHAELATDDEDLRDAA